MTELIVTHAQLLFARRDLRGATSKNGLTAVKLARIRRAVDTEFPPIATEWGKIDAQFAARDEHDATKVKTADGKPLSWTVSETPFYEYDETQLVARQSALSEFDQGTLMLSVPLLTERDLACIDCDRDIGDTLALFSEC